MRGCAGGCQQPSGGGAAAAAPAKEGPRPAQTPVRLRLGQRVRSGGAELRLRRELRQRGSLAAGLLLRLQLGQRAEGRPQEKSLREEEGSVASKPRKGMEIIFLLTKMFYEKQTSLLN